MHVVNALAEHIRELLLNATDADERISRDRAETERFEAADLPAVDIRIGSEEDFAPQVQSLWRATVKIHVDLYTADAEELASSAVLELRRQAYRALMGATEWPGGFLRILPAPAEEVLRNKTGSIPVATQRTTFLVLYQHSLTDAEA